MRQVVTILVIAVTVGVFAVPATAQKGDIAEVSLGYGSVTWQPLAAYPGLSLAVSTPDGEVIQQTFGAGETPSLAVSGAFPDGQYMWELLVVFEEAGVREEDGPAAEELPPSALVQSGSFAVSQGAIVDSSASESTATKDVLHYDDVIITGSLGVGFDCANGESFGYATIKLKENNLQLLFEDTSIGSFPTNDWKFQVNDSTSGGASYFTLWDVDGGRRPFTIEAGAPSHSLYVEDYGRVGLGTSIPYVELHMKDGDSPTVRLDQDGSSGWAAQSWDLCGNETNFFIRDVTHGSKLCMRIQPNTPSNTLCMRSTGYVGIGTWSPGWPLEVETTGEAATFVLERTDGAMAYINAGGTYVNMGSCSNNHVRWMANGVWKAQLNTDGTLTMASGASCTAGGIWTNSSSRELKDNIESLSASEAMEALTGLEPVKYNYKLDETDAHVGFIAEDVPDLVATKDRKGMSPMDVTAVLTKVVQEQERVNREQQRMIAELQARLEALEKGVRE
jgi:Chaperone of endosialidase